MTQAKFGDVVKVHYEGKLEDGTVFDTSTHRPPLQFTIGKQEVIPGFEQAVVGMEAGESKIAKIAAEKAFGPYREGLFVEVDRKKIPEDVEPKVGEQLQTRQADGQAAVVTVADVTDSSVTLDFNHPLAGKDLIFDIRLLEIV